MKKFFLLLTSVALGIGIGYVLNQWMERGPFIWYIWGLYWFYISYRGIYKRNPFRDLVHLFTPK